MATREEYNACMRPFISGKGIPKEERRSRFCVGAKLCAGKATSEAQAAEMCRNSPPSSARGPKKPRGCNAQAEQLVACILPKLTPGQPINPETFRNAVFECQCGKPAPKISRAKKMAKAYEDMTEEEKATVQMIGQMAAQFGTGG